MTILVRETIILMIPIRFPIKSSTGGSLKRCYYGCTLSGKCKRNSEFSADFCNRLIFNRLFAGWERSGAFRVEKRCFFDRKAALLGPRSAAFSKDVLSM